MQDWNDHHNVLKTSVTPNELHISNNLVDEVISVGSIPYVYRPTQLIFSAVFSFTLIGSTLGYFAYCHSQQSNSS